MLINLTFGGRIIPVEVPDENLFAVLYPPQVRAVKNPKDILRDALERPMGTPVLKEMARRARKIAIIGDDITRQTPTRSMVEMILDELNAAQIDSEQITLVVGLGTHRPMTGAEIRTKYGNAVVNRIRVENHDCLAANLVEAGTTPRGARVLLNRTVASADLVIGVGSIVPHHICGFSGGAKIIATGVAGRDTVGHTHLLSTTTRPDYLGEVDNIVRDEMEAVSRLTSRSVVFDAVLNASGETVTAVFGDMCQAFCEGAKRARKVWAVPFARRTDIVLANAHCCELDFWQAHKSLYPAARIVKAGGSIIVAASCPEGVSRVHSSLPSFASLSAAEIHSKVERGEIDDVPAAALAIAWATIREHARVVLVSDGIKDHEVTALGFRPSRSVQEALSAALVQSGQQATVTVLPCAPNTLPTLRSEGRVS